MKKLLCLGYSLKELGLTSEANFILKKATIHGLVTLGYPEYSAKLINKVVGDHWDFVVGKWIIDYYLRGKEDIRSMMPDFYSKVEDNLLGSIKALQGLDKVLKIKDMKKRELILSSKGRSEADDNSIVFLKKWLDKSDLNEKELYQYGEDNDKSSYYEKNSSPDETIKGYKDYFEENIIKKIESFIKSEFITHVMSNNWMPPGVLKNMSYEEALSKWLDRRIKDFSVILDMDDGWKWIDSGNGKSDWVCRKLKNCGNSSWANLKATKESAEKARMLILVDPKEEPHAIVTWNPEYEEYSNKNKPIKYLSDIEGVGSSPLKDEYYPYFLKLVDYLNPDSINIRSKTTMYVDRTVSNENLRKLINKELLV
jgi:hypothetical protein